MTCAVLLLLGTAAAQDGAEAFAGRLTFEEARPEGEAGARVVAVLKDPAHWRAGVRAIEARLGPMPALQSVAVSFDHEGDEAAKAAVRDRAAFVRFNLRKLEAQQRRVDDFERQKRELAKEGKRIVFKVPPARLDRIIWHELVHVFHGDLEAPRWFTEGLAQWLSDDPNAVRAFVHEEKEVEDVDAPPRQPEDVYARGHLFWSWVASRGATKAVVRGAILERGGWKEALEKALAMAWSDLLRNERDWSRKEVVRLRDTPLR